MSNDSVAESDSDQPSLEVYEKNVTDLTSLPESELISLLTDPSVQSPTNISQIEESARIPLLSPNDISDRFLASLTGKISKYSKRIKAHMYMVSFNYHDTVLIFSPLESYKTPFNYSYVNEGLAVPILPYLLEALLKQKLVAYIHHLMVPYPTAINSILDVNSRNQTINQNTVLNYESAETSQSVCILLCRLHPFPNQHCGSAQRPINKIRIFIHGIIH